MPATSIWTWTARQRFIRSLLVVAWLVYIGIAVLVIMQINPRFAIPLLVVFVGSPALIHLLWTFVPGYFLMRDVIRLVPSREIEAQVSRNANHADPLGSPSLPGDLSNMRPVVPSLSGGSPIQVKTVWDRHLFVAARRVGVVGTEARRGMKATLLVDSSGLSLIAGWWRPGVVFTLPASAVCGLWHGSDVVTIGDRDVLVVVIDNDDDQVLFPFTVTSWSQGDGKKFRVDELITRTSGILVREA